jgi:L-ascorbate metabolism protein UlaG (beta-lactamase superfamily)
MSPFSKGGVAMTAASFLLGFLMAVPGSATAGQAPFEVDAIGTSAGELAITFIGHGTLMFAFGGKIIHVDPYGKLADYGTLPKADLVLITHEHGDHLDVDALNTVRTADTVVVATAAAAGSLGDAVVMRNGDVQTRKGVRIEAVPAYNIVHRRDTGQPFHPRGAGNGYVLTFGDKRVYVAGDTENIPEMKTLKDIDVAFLPMNLPYTMTPEMVADAARMFRPTVLYPYHYGSTDPAALTRLLAAEKGIEVRIRKMR